MNTKTEKISVIIPCYNVEKYVSRCLDSLLNQTINKEMFEIVCIDDKSSDDTLKVLKEYSLRLPELIRIIELPENGRQGKARNVGLSEARGEWIAFIDSDDWVEREYLEFLYDKAHDESGSIDIVACSYIRDPSKELTYQNDVYDADTTRSVKVSSAGERHDFVRNRVLDYAVYCKLIRRSFLKDNDISFPESLAYEDIYWGGLINMYAARAAITEAKLYHYFINVSSTLLSADAGYHYDMLTVQEQLWNEYIRRGLMDEYGAEIELEFVYSCALAFWKVIALRFKEPPYSMYQLLCVFTQTHIPDIWNNRYIKEGALTEFHMLILKSLFDVLSRDDFMAFAENIKRIGI